MSGFNDSATAFSLAKQLIMDCEGDGDITIHKETLKIVLGAFVNSWQAQQDLVRSSFKKAAT